MLNVEVGYSDITIMRIGTESAFECMLVVLRRRLIRVDVIELWYVGQGDHRY